MLRIYLNSAPPHGVEVSPMASLARPVDVLKQAALVALDDVVVPCPCRAFCRQREGQLPERGRLPQHGQPPDRDARRGELGRSGEEVEVVTATLHEGVDQPGRRRLNASME